MVRNVLSGWTLDILLHAWIFYSLITEFFHLSVKAMKRGSSLVKVTNRLNEWHLPEPIAPVLAIITSHLCGNHLPERRKNQHRSVTQSGLLLGKREEKEEEKRQGP